MEYEVHDLLRDRGTVFGVYRTLFACTRFTGATPGRPRLLDHFSHVHISCCQERSHCANLVRNNVDTIFTELDIATIPSGVDYASVALLFAPMARETDHFLHRVTGA